MRPPLDQYVARVRYKTGKEQRTRHFCSCEIRRLKTSLLEYCEMSHHTEANGPDTLGSRAAPARIHRSLSRPISDLEEPAHVAHGQGLTLLPPALYALNFTNWKLRNCTTLWTKSKE